MQYLERQKEAGNARSNLVEVEDKVNDLNNHMKNVRQELQATQVSIYFSSTAKYCTWSMKTFNFFKRGLTVNLPPKMVRDHNPQFSFATPPVFWPKIWNQMHGELWALHSLLRKSDWLNLCKINCFTANSSCFFLSTLQWLSSFEILELVTWGRFRGSCLKYLYWKMILNAGWHALSFWTSTLKRSQWHFTGFSDPYYFLS